MLFIFAVPISALLLYNRFFNKSEFPLPASILERKKVTVQLPLYNEIYVVERLINSVCEIEYPQSLLEIQILDDSTDETKELVDKITEEKKSAGYNIKILRRKTRTGYKGGALREALQNAEGDFIAIFDADFVPGKDFLKKTLYYFDDEKVGVVQTRWEHLNEKYSILTKIQASVLDNHFAVDQLQKYKAGMFINFNGTGGVWRKDTIIDSGNWQDDTLTEDLDLSYRAQLKGWKFIYLNDVCAPAELPVEINSIKSQQFRWTKGAMETGKKLLPKIWKAKIPLTKKIYSTFHLSGNLIFPIIILLSILNLPLLIIKNKGMFPHLFNFMSIFLSVLLITFVVYLFAQKNFYPDWKDRIKYFPVYLAGTMGLAVNNSKAIFEALFNKKSEFIRTPKFKIIEKSADYRNNKYLNGTKINIIIFFEAVLALYAAAASAIAIYLSDFASLPVLLLFLTSFAGVSFYSIKPILIDKLNRKKK